jgi:hypothetical protein
MSSRAGRTTARLAPAEAIGFGGALVYLRGCRMVAMSVRLFLIAVVVFTIAALAFLIATAA